MIVIVVECGFVCQAMDVGPNWMNVSTGSQCEIFTGEVLAQFPETGPVGRVVDVGVQLVVGDGI